MIISNFKPFIPFVQDTPSMRARRAIHKIRSELVLARGKAKAVEMDKDTFEQLRQLTISTTFDLRPATTPEGAMGAFGNIPINQNNAIAYGHALIVYKEGI